MGDAGELWPAGVPTGPTWDSAMTSSGRFDANDPLLPDCSNRSTAGLPGRRIRGPSGNRRYNCCLPCKKTES